MWEERVEREVVEHVGPDVVERTELAVRQRFRAKPEIHLPGRVRRESGPEQLICRCQCISWPEPCQSVEDDLGRRVESRTGLGENIGTRSSRGKRETEEEEKNRRTE